MKSLQGTSSNGQALIIVLVIISILLAAGMVYARTVLSERKASDMFIRSERSFYIAEAGLEDGKKIVALTPNWFTDNPHTPPDDADWLIDKAVGSTKLFGGGSYKIVRESGKDMIYCVGNYRSSKSVIRLKFTAGGLKIL